MKDYDHMLEQLKAGELSSLEVPKEEFLDFRSILVKRADFKHFRGTAHHFGRTVYTYTIEPSK
ncbi:MAG TPA: hypothetical protein VK947_03905 [Planococcus sp. (in: firmicutes)]|nr:hypothetical protein [Planococcus sp. (in: firmicutes)]